VRRQHHRVHVVGPRWAFALAPLLLAGSLFGAYGLGRLHGAPNPKRGFAGRTGAAGSAAAPGPTSVVPERPRAEKDGAPPSARDFEGSSASESFVETAPAAPEAVTATVAASSPPPPQQGFEAPPKRGWGVQVGAFAEPDEVGAWLEAHRPRSPAFVSEVDLDERGTWYRLRLGRYSTRREARRAARRWADRLDEAPLVVEYP